MDALEQIPGFRDTRGVLNETNTLVNLWRKDKRFNNDFNINQPNEHEKSRWKTIKYRTAIVYYYIFM